VLTFLLAASRGLGVGAAFCTALLGRRIERIEGAL